MLEFGKLVFLCNQLTDDSAHYIIISKFLCEITSAVCLQLQVPVVMGGGNYTLDAPPNSFIDVRDFSTVEALTKYLKYLIDNPVSFFVNRAVI